MTTLLPSELWDYSLGDAMRGLRVAMRPGGSSAVEPIVLPRIGPTVPIRSGRAGIVAAIRALGLGKGARIGVPLYCCPVVFKAVEAAGCVNRFIDIDTNTYCASLEDLESKQAEIDALIAVHMFGHVCNMPRLREVVGKKPIIEDCAQALGSRLHNGEAGSFGDIGVFSFRSGKYLSVGEGASLFSRQSALEGEFSRFISQLPVPNRSEECSHVFSTCLRSLLRSKPFWGLAGTGIWRIYNRRTAYAAKSPLVMGPIYRSDRATVLRRLPRLDGWIQRQRNNADYYLHELALDGRMLSFEPPHAQYNRLQFPILAADPAQCDRLVAHLRKHQISTARPYREIAAIAAAHHGYRGDCPVSERVAQTVFVIPCHHALKPGDVERVARHLNAGWRGIAAVPSKHRPCLAA